MSPRSTVLAAMAAVSVALAGCGNGTTDVSGVSDPTASASTLSGDLTVFAAASLTDSFETLGEDFTAEHPDVEVAFNFAGSSGLAAQITSGAPADVFASASPATMATVVDAGDATDEPQVIAGNRLQIVTPAGNPAGVSGLADFGDESLAIGLCAPEVPCGAAAEAVFEAAGTTAAPDTLEQDVRAVLSKVELGELDAALVYRTDVLVAGDAVEGIDFDEATDAVNDYPIVVLDAAPNGAVAEAFVEYILSAEGQRVLADAGFDAP